MAKKNSSKTATEKVIQSSEPRVMSYGDWKGVNFVDSPLTWEPLENGRYDHNQTDLPKNYLMVQNNLITTDTLSVETRPDSIAIGECPANTKFTGVSFVFHRWLFCVVRTTNNGNNNYDYIIYKALEGFTIPSDYDSEHPNDNKCLWHNINMRHYSEVGSYTNNPTNWYIYEIGAYENNLVVTATNMNVNIIDEQVIDAGREAAVFLAKLNYDRQANTIDIKGESFGPNGSNASGYVVNNPPVPNPTAAPVLSVVGMNAGPTSLEGTVNEESGTTSNDHVVKIEVCYCYTTRFGSTLTSPSAYIFAQFDPTLWSSARYVNVSTPRSTVKYLNSSKEEVKETFEANSTTYTDKTIQQIEAINTTGWDDTEKQKVTIALSTARSKVIYIQQNYVDYDPNIYIGTGITGIDFYGRDTENIDWVFIGHININSTITEATGIGTNENPGTTWNYAWLGNMTDISQWTNSQLNVPTENNTRGPNVSHWAVHDSKLYYWGDPLMPYRLYIGGSPGNEFSVARGLGGAWVDIEPGSGYNIMGTAKWKTNGGANIVTIMCGNSNTTKVKRFNLVETNITITNEISYKGYMYEEVSNVVGCNSRYGYGVFAEGLYSLTRYGLYLTTMAMEYNNQMKNQSVSEVIKPIFSERLGNRLKDARMVFIDDVIYIALSAEGSDGEGVINLDNVILCYDTVNQAWYTFTCDVTIPTPTELNPVPSIGDDSDQIHHILAIDSDEFQEGLGVITDTKVLLYPTTGIQSASVPVFDIIMETGELMPKEPMQVLSYIQQVELRFDYFVCNPSDPPIVLIEGVDYYGRAFVIEKHLNISGGRGYHGKTGEMRDYVEWIRVDRYVESWRMRIKGKARFRLTHINVKWYQQADNIGTQWGFDALNKHHDAHNTEGVIHHYIEDYNNLRRAVIS